MPWIGSDALAITLGPPSGSVSFPSTLIAVASASSATVALSVTAVGATSGETETLTVAVSGVPVGDVTV